MSTGRAPAIPSTALSSIARLGTTGFSKYLATELVADGVRINNVLPALDQN